jgi:pseudaminic acid cytidylyltransferase
MNWKKLEFQLEYKYLIKLKRIAIIPARAGSKRIKQKNIKKFNGKPIIAYSIESAINSGLFDEIMVSTDCGKIAEIALEYGATVPFMRSYENSNDFATTVDVLTEVIERYKMHNHFFDQATCIYACAPFVTSDLLKMSFRILNDQKCDCVFPVIPYSHPIQRALTINENHRVISFIEGNLSLRTQDFEKTFHDAGMFYTFNINNLIKNKSLRTQNTCAIEIDELCAHDIDSEKDWIMAELKYKLFKNE